MRNKDLSIAARFAKDKKVMDDAKRFALLECTNSDELPILLRIAAVYMTGFVSGYEYAVEENAKTQAQLEKVMK